MIRPTYQGDLREIPVSTLAYIGDAVYELYTRLALCQAGCGKSGELHRQTVRKVKASAQAQAARQLLPLLTEEEAAIFRRARNSQSGSSPKNADPVDYRVATGLEAVIGYLYLSQANDRLEHLMRMILEDNYHAQTAVAEVQSPSESGQNK